MKQQIEQEIRKAITRHLVQHVQVPKEENRDRIDILVEEAAIAILNEMMGNRSPKKVYVELFGEFPLEDNCKHVAFHSYDDMIKMGYGWFKLENKL